MRHPTLRILAALLIGLWSPLCCCRAGAITGDTCPPGVSAAAESKTGCCASSCCGEESESEQRTTPDRHEHAPGEPGCPTCPSCLGPLGSAGLLSTPNAELASIHAFVGLVVIIPMWAMDQVGTPGVSGRESPWTGPPPCLRSNRVALRWHCALIV